MTVRSFEDLAVWRRAVALCVDIYRVSETGAFASDFGLRDQIRRAALSSASNIAEGFERYSRQEFRQFLSIARGSTAEVRSQLYVARELGYLGQEDFDRLVSECIQGGHMIGGLRDSLRG